MGTIGATLALAALTTGQAAAQTVYRSVGPDGRVTFSDTPPAKAVQTQSLEGPAAAASASGQALPFALRQVVSKYPVTLYTSTNCAPCDSGRNLLRGRGVPFTEKTVTTEEDIGALQRLTGSSTLPFLMVGAQHIKGYSDVEWTQYLGAAGYPEKSQLPAGYRNPAATPLVTAAAATPTAAASAPDTRQPKPGPTPPPAPVKRVNPDNPAGIQF
ncbi:glutaredoxin family protein [Rhodoferax sp.]|uniref:glutaredoxin family protein n=1 Tax=Rhodoferax sp. TaxID=50421 RepID=UPI00261E93C8|nr:glutaredoxin family protein [Rhodoferax sp.]MDD2926636.1 glutaredoxin family protein [Rhodoferax sp.]